MFCGLVFSCCEEILFCFRNFDSSSSNAIKPKTGRHNWKKFYEYKRTTNRNYEKNFENFEMIKFSRESVVIGPDQTVFFAVHSVHKTSYIGVSDDETTKETDVYDDGIIEIRPGHTWNTPNEEIFFKELLGRSSYWNFPCGKIHYQIVREPFPKFPEISVSFFCVRR